MLRPATPLTIIFFVAFVLLLLSVLSTPIIKGIPLAEFQGVDYGVFGFCNTTAGGECSPFQVGYSTDLNISQATSADFTLPSDTRHTLSAILIVHPIAALLTLICTILAAAAHLHSPAHSSRYLLALLILTFPTLLVTLLAFLVDLLLFVPHLQWGGWIVLASTILIVAALVVTCAMRRTLVSRKARKKRIAENAEMNGENYYNSRDANFGLAKAESPPPTAPGLFNDNAIGSEKTGFATFESRSAPTSAAGRTSEDNVPLNPAAAGVGFAMGAAAVRSMSADPSGRRPTLEDSSSSGVSSYSRGGGMNGSNMRGGPPPNMRGRGGPYAGAPSYGAFPNSSQTSFNTNPPQGQMRGAMPPPGYNRGRGGYPSRGMPPRGGYGPPRGSYGPPRGGPMRGRGGPPPGWNGRGAPQDMDYGEQRGMNPIEGAALGVGAGAAAGAIMGHNHEDLPRREMSPPGYDRNRFYQNKAQAQQAQAQPQSQQLSEEQYVEPAIPVGQAVEMDARTGRESSAAGPRQNPMVRDSDSDIQGFVALQQQPRGATDAPFRAEDGLMSPSVYSEPDRTSFIPARANWNPPRNGSPLNPQQSRLEPIEASPTELPTERFTRTSPAPPQARSRSQSRSSARSPGSRNGTPGPPGPPPSMPPPATVAASHHRSGSGSYYEDVDPRFASPEESGSSLPIQSHNTTPSPLPPALAIGGINPGVNDRDLLPSQRRKQSLENPPRPRYDGAGYSYRSSASAYDDSTPHASLNPPPLRAHPNGFSGPVDSAFDEADPPLPPGARSPGAQSDASHFTSVSQRGINPNWRPPPPPGYGGPGGFGPGPYGPPGPRSEGGRSAGAPRPLDMDLTGPDFNIPGVTPGRPRPGPQTAGAAQRGARSPPSGLGFSVDGPGRGDGRYPAAI